MYMCKYRPRYISFCSNLVLDKDIGIPWFPVVFFLQIDCYVATLLPFFSFSGILSILGAYILTKMKSCDIGNPPDILSIKDHWINFLTKFKENLFNARKNGFLLGSSFFLSLYFLLRTCVLCSRRRIILMLQWQNGKERTFNYNMIVK